jgi:NADPH-dependent F420 reductase
MSDHLLVTIGVIGGTGKEGSGLAMRWAQNGYPVIIGSRDASKAEAKAAEINIVGLSGADNLTCVERADIVVLSVPYDAQKSTLDGLKDALQGKIMIDVTVPLKPPAVRTVNLPAGGSACLESQAFLGSGVKVVAAFQNVSSTHLSSGEDHVACDVLVCGDDDAAKDQVITLVKAAGMRGLDAGPLANAVAVESLTPVLLWFNKRYKIKGAGIVITGIE